MKILKNRFVLGCICIVLAFAIGFIAVPLLTDVLNDKVTVVVAAVDVKKGEEISSDKLKTIQLSLGDIPYITGQYYNCIDVSNGEQKNNRIILKDSSNSTRTVYASMDMKVNDVVTDEKITTEFPYTDEKLRMLENNEYAVAVSVSSLAAGLGAKVAAGDIVSLMVCGGDSTAAIIPAELMYVEIMSIGNSDAAVINENSNDSATGIPSVITFKVNLYQAQLLAGFEQTSKIHLALACRGDDEKAQQLLNKQHQYFVDNDLLYDDAWFYMTDGSSVSGG